MLSQLAHIQNNKGKPFLSVFSGHSSDITHWFWPIKHSYFHAKNHIQKLTGQLKAIWMCDNCNNMPTGLSGKGLYCWILHLFHEEVFPLPSFTAVRNSLKKKLQTWPNSIVLHSRYHFVHEVSQVRFHSDKLASVLRPKQRKRESGLRKLCEINGKCHLNRKGKSLLATIKAAVNYRNCQVEELWSCGVPMVFMYHNLGSVSITRQGNFYYETSVKPLHFKPLFLI